MKNMILAELNAHREITDKVIEALQSEIKTACQIAVDTIKSGNKILLCGNGGSAADAQHIAAELSGRYVKERRGLPGIALTTDTSVLTAVANDYSFENIFSRQAEALATSGDLLVGISTSGNSRNVIKAFAKAAELGCRTLGLCGRDGGKMKDACDFNIIVPSNITARIQEMHILIGHILCQAIDQEF